ncbi:MAG: hypothetical protein GX801_04585 [Fibrobacter sp.]|nr:hypothetical protein [Fibrobacter sp.]
MRELIEKIIRLGFSVVFSANEEGEPCILIYPQSSERTSKSKAKFSCVLTPGTFQEASETVLEDFLKKLQMRV